eukprot:TRINITY_DN28705_c1_g4_i2.p1 TRINITY_DN28705_c1_g4~~TRINITY_DN28705_c1_g4_i2.p1  ORF type:complete len:191 (+),score=34.94 TRINITY_DN28705_c1_g4_i2:165-737(+)
MAASRGHGSSRLLLSWALAGVPGFSRTRSLLDGLVRPWTPSTGGLWPQPSPPLALAYAADVPPAEGAAATVARALQERSARAAAGIDGAARAAAAAVEAAAELFGFSVLFKKSRKMRGVHGTFNPSLWRWYHRHGYWATRRKLIDFGTKRRWRYHQVVGDGKRSMKYGRSNNQFWMDKSYYRPFKNYCRF